MEAKIDVRKLQLLSDRIQQTIDALNQVRSSVSGLSHSGVGPQFGQAYGGQAYGGQAYGGQAYGAPAQPITMGAFNPGYQPQQVAPWGAPLQHSVPQAGLQALAAQPMVTQIPTMMGLAGGLTHTSAAADQRNAELRACDPVRISQTFPYLFTQVAPLPVI